MARSLLSAILLILTLTLTLGASRSASQKIGFQSINCGGDAYNDTNTMLVWEADPFIKMNNVMMHGKVGQVISSLKNITNVMKTLRFFPNYERNVKFCYPLQVSNGSTYLLRASFLYGNYDGLNKPPTFSLIFNFDQWTDVVTTSSTTPIMHELTFISKRDDLTICLAPNLASNHTPFISTLELRLLNSTMYNTGPNGSFYLDFGLMLSQRINYGATSKEAIRYPDDPYDRIWEANTTGPIANTSTSKMGSLYLEDTAQPPAEVMATAITSKGNLSFTYNGFGGDAGFQVQVHFEEVAGGEVAGGIPRTFGIDFPNSSLQILGPSIVKVPSGSPIAAFFDQPLELPVSFQMTLYPMAGSPRGPLLNAIELFRWTPQPLLTIATFQGDVDAIELIQEYFKLVGYGQGDPCMPNGYGWTWIACSDDTPPRIIAIYLGSFNLMGDIPQEINNITHLEIIDLSNNMLSGGIPDLNLLLNLKYLDLHNNSLTGELPPSLLLVRELTKLDVSYNDLCGSLTSFQFFQPLINLSYIGNPKLCNSSNCECNFKSSFGSTNSTKKYIFAISFLGALYILSVLILFIYKVRHRRAKVKNSTSAIATDKKGFDDLEGLPFIIKMFTYNEISNATLNFTTILGEGGFGKVYQGLLPNGESIAVKMLANASKQGVKEFFNEVTILSRVRHKNLVSLIGYCVENTYMLIYEYISKGNLRDLLYGHVESSEKPLPWTTRLHIALDASQGLEYLHTGCDPIIIHRDVKSSNILLSDKMQAKVSDFGLSRLKEGDTNISHVSTVNVVGTAGYLDPAYNSTNQLTDKSDVYSFGIVLFELICGRGAIDMFTSPPHIVDWVTPAIMEGKVEDIVDPVLANGYKRDSMKKVVDVAFGCVENDRVKRLKMSHVVQLLKNALEIEMDESLQDVSGTSSTSDGKLPTLQYIDDLQIKPQPR